MTTSRSVPCRVPLVLALGLASGCTRGSPPARAAGDTVDTPSPEVRVTAQPEQRGALMLGTWDISPTGVAGPYLAILVDSASGEQFHGRLIRAFAGNVGLSPEQFRPFAGAVAADSTARLTMTLVPEGVPPVEMAGKVTGPLWELSHFVWAGTEQVVPGRTWTGRRTD